MRTLTRTVCVLATLTLLPLPALATGGGGGPVSLKILLTNDDGFDSEGIMAMRQALIDDGHDVTIVAPADQQSGKGGSINTGAFDFTPGGGTMQLTKHAEGIWSLAGTPADSVKAGLNIVLDDDPPDLVVSGLNEGQNLGKPGSNASGTDAPAGVCFATVGVGFSPDPDPVKRADVNAFRDGFISITPMDADMTSSFGGLWGTAIQLKPLEP